MGQAANGAALHMALCLMLCNLIRAGSTCKHDICYCVVEAPQPRSQQAVNMVRQTGAGRT